MNKNLTINWIDVVDSTNSEALRSAYNVSSGTVWSADLQTAGRGQRGNKWLSVKGKNLTYSILVKPYFLRVEDQFLISMISALSVYKYLINKGLYPKIKWPNDIYVGNRKICGMLIENVCSSDSLAVCVVGIGVNINQTEFDPELVNPTSLLLETNSKSDFDRRLELDLLLDEFFRLYDMIQSKDGRESVYEMFNEAIYRKGEWHRYVEIGRDVNLNMPVEQIEGDYEFEGKILGIDSNFNILIERRDGEVNGYAFKEIKYLL